MLLRTYGGLRFLILKYKTASLIIACAFIFALLYLNKSSKEVDDGRVFHYQPGTYAPHYIDMKYGGIGEVGLIPDYKAALVDIKPMVLPQPRVFDNEGNEYALRFLITGDWGGQSEPPHTTPVQLNLAKALGDFARRYETRFILSLGDNFCDEGVKDVDDHRFQDSFEKVFTSPSLFRPWYIVAGNDDYKGNVTAQIEYTYKSKRWFFERLYYKISFQLPTYRNVTVDILMIDTVQLCGMIPPGQYQPTEPEDEEKAEAQWKWIEKNLKRSSASYLLVAGHYPVYSGGHHGSTICLKRRLKPLLEAYKVSAYFSGHDHSVQHYKGKDTKGVHYFITGATHPRDDSPEHLDGVMDSSQFFWTASLNNEVGAFTYCDINKDVMSVAFVTTEQKVLYFAAVAPRANKHVIVRPKPVPPPLTTEEVKMMLPSMGDWEYENATLSNIIF